MAVPRNRMSNARKNSKRAHHAKVKQHPAACPRCGTAKVPHAMCGSCGWYNNREIVAIKAES